MRFNVQNLWLKENQPEGSFGICLLGLVCNTGGFGLYFFNFIIDVMWTKEDRQPA